MLNYSSPIIQLKQMIIIETLEIFLNIFVYFPFDKVFQIKCYPYHFSSSSTSSPSPSFFNRQLIYSISSRQKEQNREKELSPSHFNNLECVMRKRLLPSPSLLFIHYHRYHMITSSTSSTSSSHRKKGLS